ncbi:hypothetical protein VIGAN_01115600 [Vigna angularis var. angularis]|uniref:Uncharacterized protein n=1 Tax=Vigna angularis var. angularis TaxID=157739 RepID=A0A0S3QZ71_PHAAN|nr:hypothetical protein VIGAN_01115600 [Vigna angularis var. angularis]
MNRASASSRNVLPFFFPQLFSSLLFPSLLFPSLLFPLEYLDQTSTTLFSFPLLLTFFLFPPLLTLHETPKNQPIYQALVSSAASSNRSGIPFVLTFLLKKNG